MDYFAIATLGFFPTPTPTDTQRMAYAGSWGYLSVAGEASDEVAMPRFLKIIKNTFEFGTGFFKIGKIK